VDKEALRIIDNLVIDYKGVNIEANYEEHKQVLLSWAAKNGYEAVV